MAKTTKRARRPAAPETAIAKVIREALAAEPTHAPITAAPGTWTVLAIEVGRAPRTLSYSSEAGAMECVRGLQAAGNVGLWLEG